MTIAGARNARARGVAAAVEALGRGEFDEDYPARAWVELVENLDAQGIALPSRSTDAPLGPWVATVARAGQDRVAAANASLVSRRRMRLTPFQRTWQHTYAAVEHGLCVADLLGVDRHMWRDGPMLVMISLGLGTETGSSLGLQSLGQDFPGLGVRAALGWLAVRIEVNPEIQNRQGLVQTRAAQALAMRAVMRGWDRVGMLEQGWLGHAAGLGPDEAARDWAGATEEDLLVLAALRDGLVWVPER